MSAYRRTIAVFLLVLFTCQSVLAGVDEHAALTSGDVVDSAGHSDATVADDPSHSDSEHGHSGATGLVDADCCHAHGHCHLLAFVGCPPADSLSQAYARSAPRMCFYHSLYKDTLLRPPARA